jgi:peptidylprolyl isomerase
MGVERTVLNAGSGPSPQTGQTVTVHCTGKLENGKKFWSTKDEGQTVFSFQIGLGKVVKGWDEGVAQMQLGETANLVCSPDYAYGSRGFPAVRLWLLSGTQRQVSQLTHTLYLFSLSPLTNSGAFPLTLCSNLRLSCLRSSKKQCAELHVVAKVSESRRLV